MELFEVIAVTLLCHASAVPLNIISIPKGLRGEPPVSDLKFLTPIKVIMYPKYEDNILVKKEPIELVPDDSVSRLPDEEFIQDDSAIDRNVNKGTVHKDSNSEIASEKKLYPSNSAHSLCIQYLKEVDLRKDHGLQSYCNRLLELEVNNGGDFDSNENLGTGHVSTNSKEDNTEDDDNHEVEVKGIETDHHPTKNESCFPGECLHLNLYIRIKDENLRSEEDDMPVKHNNDVLRAITLRVLASDVLKKNRGYGRLEHTSIERTRKEIKQTRRRFKMKQ